MKRVQSDYKKGFSALEIIIVVSIFALLSAVSLVAFSDRLRSSSVEQEAENALSYITKAHTQSVASEDNSSFGIRISSTTLDFFKGTSFALGDDIISYNLKETRAVVDLSDDASEFYFTRITGTPSHTGTITLVSRKNASTTKTILIQGTGLAEIQ
jgi:prepilin-type N-terminal cleavage/methylation domain-containing protein